MTEARIVLKSVQVKKKRVYKAMGKANMGLPNLLHQYGNGQ